jgi:hypothetical protein
MSLEGAALAFDILSTGISEMTQGDIHYTGPSSDVGVLAPGLKDEVRVGLQAKTKQEDIFTYQRDANAGFELVNVKLRCYVQWNGPEVKATFMFPADGMRCRLNNDAYVTIGNPLGLETKPASDAWKRIGVPNYPVVQLPVSIFIDHPWPASNYKVSFMLVLSGMYGFGADDHEIYDDYNAYWD